MDRLIKKIQNEILTDMQMHGKEDGRFSLSDRYYSDVDFSRHKTAVNTLNEDINFPYTLYIMLIENVVKIQYSPLGSKFYEYKTPSEVIDVLEKLVSHVKRLDADKNIANSTYMKQGEDELNILVEGITGKEILDIDITNTFKMD